MKSKTISSAIPSSIKVESHELIKWIFGGLFLLILPEVLKKYGD